MENLTGKTVFITGAASGIGFGMARAFAREGMQVALADIEPESLARAERELLSMGVRALAVSLDVTDRAALRRAAATTESAFGKVHVVCANAGVGGRIGPLDEATDADWDWVLEVNLKGTVNTVQAFLPYIKSHGEGGQIVITASMSGIRVFRPGRGQGIYNTTKFALMGFGEALGLDLEPHNIGVSILCPGFVDTSISASGRNRPQRYGGPFDSLKSGILPAPGSGGTDPLDYGRWVVKAVRDNRLFVITHTGERHMVEERHSRLMAAFDNARQLTGQGD